MPTLATLLLLVQTSNVTAETPALYERLSARVAAAYDSTRGGFVSKDRMPSESAIELALLRAADGGDPAWGPRALRTLDWMHGLLDTLTGGYYPGVAERGSGEEALGKRADSNARRLELLLAAGDLTGDPAYRADAARVVDFFDRVLLDGRGGFVTAQLGDRDLEPAANGKAIHAWLVWAAGRADRRTRDFALRSLDRVWETCWVPGLGLLRRDSFGDPLSEPLLTDQVEMGRAFVLAARLCGRAADGERAVLLGELLIARYREPGGGFRRSSVPKRDGSIQKAPKEPAGNARAALFLAELGARTGNPRYRAAAAETWKVFDRDFDKLGLGAADWALAVRASYAPGLPVAPVWAESVTPDPPARKRSVTIKLGHY
jgi:uncharacterized protein YyaL (SSP411 family)